MTFLRWQWLGRVMLDARLPDYAKIVAFWMAEHANSKLLTAFPSVETLVKLTGSSESQVQRARRILVGYGWLALVERKPGPHGVSRYRLEIGLTVLPTGCADVKAAMRMFRDGVRADTNSKKDGVRTDGDGVRTDRDGVRADTNYPINGVRADTRTSSKREPRHDHRHDHRHRDGDDDDDLLASRIEKIFRETVHEVYGDSARPIKPSRVIRREALGYLAGLSFSEVSNVIKEGTRKMAKNGHQAPMCLSALSHNFEDALQYLNKSRL